MHFIPMLTDRRLYGEFQTIWVVAAGFRFSAIAVICVQT